MIKDAHELDGVTPEKGGEGGEEKEDKGAKVNRSFLSARTCRPLQIAETDVALPSQGKKKSPAKKSDGKKEEEAKDDEDDDKADEEEDKEDKKGAKVRSHRLRYEAQGRFSTDAMLPLSLRIEDHQEGAC